MPELPELEALTGYLNEKLSMKTITSAMVRCSDCLQNASAREFLRIMHDKTILSVSRRGKFVILNFADESKLLIHLFLKGELNIFSDSNADAEIVMYLCDGAALQLSDCMHLAEVYYAKPVAFGITGILEELGPEPLSADFDAELLKNRIKNDSRSIKLVLTDQKVVAGIGNAYVSEILYKSGVHPRATAMFLPMESVERIVAATKSILDQAINVCVTECKKCPSMHVFERESRKHLQVFLKEGSSCPLCGDTIQKVNIAARASYFCPTCQSTKGVHLS